MTSTNKLPLKSWFLIFYALGISGAVVGEWGDAAGGYGSYKIGTFQQVLNTINRVFSLAGIIDVFIFPSLASALTISSAIFIYRKVSLRLKNDRQKTLLIILFFFATFLIWILQSFALAILLA